MRAPIFLPLSASLFFTIALAVSACSDQAAATIHKVHADGLWRSVGYGKVMEIEGAHYRVYEPTRVSCLVNQDRPLSDLNVEVDAAASELVILEGFDRYRYQRIEALPDLCAGVGAEDIDRNPVRTLEVFLATIDEHFAYFDLAGADWPAVQAEARRAVTETSTDAELYTVLDGVLVTLNDGHGSVSPSTEFVFEDSAPEAAADTPALREYGDFELGALLAQTHFLEEMTEGSRLLRWGLIAEDIGYIQIDAMFLHARFPELADRVASEGFFAVYQSEFERGGTRLRLEREIAGVGDAMARAVDDLHDTDALVIDVRWNGGGLDEVGLEILRHLNDQRRLVLTKTARTQNGFTDALEIYLDARDTPYLNPVFLLVSPQTGSAAEAFSMASMALPHVTRVGARTMGALSDSFDRRLPNGWSFSMSNEIYETLDGGVYEAVGVPVDIELGYPRDRQTLFRALAENRAADRDAIIGLVRNGGVDG
jgi:carboxyl-terminal processing protease